ncbi:glutamic acid-rich protein-like [Belonocnema kinseyi]|uniref:glutamic acid-rich protein-like n=1 Tax=Belonocnema kinseyi TaxID=2817044 RepID=UPI00143DC616|nr:glutamic acid-rich protein-like [Belonocnema kinseyi]
MGNKAKKRAISELNPAEKSGNANSAGQERKKMFKKAKVNTNSPQTGNKVKEAPLTKPQVNNGNSPGELKKLKKQKVLPKSGFQVSEAESEKKDVKPGQEKVVDASVVMSKKLKKMKANQLKREKRKQVRKEQGQYRVSETMSAEHMRQKIDEIQSRGDLTKTAKRKLRIFKKKLAILEGTAPPPSPPKIQAEGGAKLTKNQKKKLRKERNQLAKAKTENADVATDKSVKTEAVLGKKVKQAMEVGNGKKFELNNVKVNLKKGNNLQRPNPKVTVAAEENDESEDDESTEGAKNDVPVATESDDSEVEDEEVDDEEDDDEEEEIENEEDEVDEEEDEESDDDDEEDVEDVASKKLTDPKGMKEPKMKNASPAVPTQENGEKKKRYVLFVGNVPFKATVEEIKQHFLQKVSDVVSVRIPTHPGTKKPRGFAYVEVSNNVDYEKGLSLHQTSLQGFKLNVEYTQTGSKNIKNKQELVAKNKKLHAIRKAGKLAGSKKENQKRSFRRNLKNKIQQPRKV